MESLDETETRERMNQHSFSDAGQSAGPAGVGVKSVGGEGGEATQASTSHLPALVAPVPRYASAQPLSPFSSNVSGQSAMSASARQQTPLSLQNQRTTSSPASGLVLPAKGEEKDAEAALQKLESMQRAKQSKRRWRIASKVNGKENREDRKAAKHDDDASSIESLNLVGEVRLAISSMPGFTVIASKARQALDRTDSPGPEGADHGEDGNVAGIAGRNTFSLRKGARRRSSLVPPTDVLSQQAKNGTALIDAQTDTVPNVPSGSADPDLSAPVPRVAATNPDLDVLKEERRIEEATDVMTDLVDRVYEAPRIASAAASNAAPSNLRRPKLTVRTPTATGGEMPMALTMSPEDVHSPSNPLSDLFRNQGLNDDASSVSHSPCPDAGSSNAIEAAEQCRKDTIRSSPSILNEPAAFSGADDVPASVLSPSSRTSESESDAEDESDLDEEEEQEVFSLSLQHGEELTPKQKRKLLRHMRRHRRKQIANAQVEDGGRDSPRTRAHRRKASLTNQLSTGLHYASSQSRNRRAMEKYSPHPSRPSSTKPFQSGLGMTSIGAALSSQQSQSAALGSISRSSTPANAVVSERSSMSNDDSGKEAAGAGNLMHNEERTKDVAHEQEDLSKNFLRRWGTNQSFAPSLAPSASIKGTSFKNRLLSLRRNRHQPSDVAEEEIDSIAREANDAEKDLDNALGRLVAQEAPEELGEQYEYDVLYENQRGMLFFGIPKFSAKTLFQWDPAAWTNSRNEDSAYNVVNAQLPNPSWEWVHPEWMIDMSGDVDESGWQYAYNWGRIALPIRVRPAELTPRANAKGNQIVNKRFEKSMERVRRREEKLKNREDDGFEALKRSALARSAKWSGIPTQNTYVRRRRWIRLRRRKPIEVAHASHPTPKSETPLGMSKGSNDWAQLLKNNNSSTKGDESLRRAGALKANGTGDINDVDGSLSDFEEGSTKSVSSTSSSSSGAYEREDGGESDFLPRRTQGDLKSGRDPMEVRATREHRRRRRHAREFTGTIRELKSLLPAILDRRQTRYHRSGNSRLAQERQKTLWLTEIDARNPFVSWSYVKRRLEDDDLAFAASSLRTIERKYARRLEEKRQRSQMPKEEGGSMIGSHAPWEQYELTKDALVEINFRRVLRVLKACKVDRQKLQLWRVWLSIEQINMQTMEPSRAEDLIELGLAASAAAASESLLRAKEELARLAKTRWRSAYTPADTMDVWDVIERRLDRLLLTFEHQSNRASFLRLLLTVHATTHAKHRFRSTSQWRLSGVAGAPEKDLDAMQANMPQALSPADVLSAGDEWQAARVPRLEFYSDLIECARALIGGSDERAGKETVTARSPAFSPKQNGSIHQSQWGGERRDSRTNSPALRASLELPQPSDGSIRSRTPVIVSGLSYALAPLSRSSTPQQAQTQVASPVPRRLSLTQTASPPTSMLFTGQARGQMNSRPSSGIFSGHAVPGRAPTGKESAGQSPQLNGGSPGMGLSASPTMSTIEFDQQFLSQLLQLPVHLQKDLVLKTCESVFETKPRAQLPGEVHEHLLVKAPSPSRTDLHRTKEENRPPSGRHDVRQEEKRKPVRTSSGRHQRTTSDVVRKLSEAVESSASSASDEGN